jgi:hypothetical protein
MYKGCLERMGYECLDHNPVSQIQKSGLNTA